MTSFRRVALAAALIAGFTAGVATAQDTPPRPAEAAPAEGTATAIFAGGCFWCVESDFDKVDGVTSTVSGYTGGTVDNPTYKQVTYENTGHYEAVKVTYDPARVDYRTLVDHLLRTVDPTDAGGQFCDRGEQYTTAVFTHGPEQARLAEASKRALSGSQRLGGQEIATVIRPAGTFYAAEDYHQDYYQKNPLRYKFYRYTCGRDGRLAELWGES